MNDWPRTSSVDDHFTACPWTDCLPINRADALMNCKKGNTHTNNQSTRHEEPRALFFQSRLWNGNFCSEGVLSFTYSVCPIVNLTQLLFQYLLWVDKIEQDKKNNNKQKRQRTTNQHWHYKILFFFPTSYLSLCSLRDWKPESVQTANSYSFFFFFFFIFVHLFEYLSVLSIKFVIGWQDWHVRIWAVLDDP